MEKRHLEQELVQIIEDHRSAIMKFIYYKVQSKEIAEDLTQIVFLKAFNNLYSFRHECALYTWLCSIAKQSIAAYYRKKRFQKIDLEGNMDRFCDEKSLTNPFDLYQIMERNECYRNFENSLSPNYSIVLKYYRLGFTIKEIAKKTGTNEEAIKKRLQRAKAQIVKKTKKNICVE